MSEASKKEAVDKKFYAAPTVEELDASALVKVRNISDRTICLASEALEVNEEGQATLAEASMLFEYITLVN